MESCNLREPTLLVEERTIVEHFYQEHRKDQASRFIVALPMKEDVDPLGESRSFAIKCFFALERSLTSSGNLHKFNEGIWEYFDMDHAEPVPAAELDKPYKQKYYIPMHVITKTFSTTTKLCVFSLRLPRVCWERP